MLRWTSTILDLKDTDKNQMNCKLSLLASSERASSGVSLGPGIMKLLMSRPKKRWEEKKGLEQAMSVNNNEKANLKLCRVPQHSQQT